MNNNHSKIKYFFLRYRWALLSILPGILFVTLFASWSSPLFERAYGADSTLYSMMGRAILAGRLPYRDYFDLKGPILFFWEALGQLLCRDRTGVFLLEVFCGAFSSYYLYKLWELYALNRKQLIISYFVFYFCYAAILWGGNTAEEFILPLNLACIYHALRFCKGQTKQVFMFFLYGITIALAFLSKATVCAPMIVLIPLLWVLLLQQKNYKKCATSALLLAAGVLTVAVPVWCYFIAKGALDDFIFCVFQGATTRAGDTGGLSIDRELNLLPCYLSFIYFFFQIKRKRIEKWMILGMAISCFAVLHLGGGYDFYFIIQLPIVALLLGCTWQDWSEMLQNRNDKVSFERLYFSFKIGAISLLVILVKYCSPTISKMKENVGLMDSAYDKAIYEASVEAFEFLPEDARENIYSLESGTIFYEINQVLPAQKYCYNMPYFCSLYPFIETDVMNYIDTKQPEYILVQWLSYFDNDNIRQHVVDNYEMVFHNDMYEIWQRKGG